MMNSATIRSGTLVIARLMMAWIFLPSGIFKLLDLSVTAAYIEGTAGLPAAGLLALATGLFEIAFGLAIIVGFKTRYVGIALAIFCLLTAALFHAGQGNVPGLSEEAIRLITELHFYMVFKNLSMAGGLLAIAIHGAGNWSVDAFLEKRNS